MPKRAKNGNFRVLSGKIANFFRPSGENFIIGGSLLNESIASWKFKANFCHFSTKIYIKVDIKIDTIIL